MLVLRHMQAPAARHTRRSRSKSLAATQHFHNAERFADAAGMRTQRTHAGRTTRSREGAAAKAAAMRVRRWHEEAAGLERH